MKVSSCAQASRASSLFMREGFLLARIPQNNSLLLDIESHL